LSTLDQHASAGGAQATTLESTRTAQRFYLANGYTPDQEGKPLRMTNALPAREQAARTARLQQRGTNYACKIRAGLMARYDDFTLFALTHYAT
jgi:hypothetical protein